MSVGVGAGVAGVLVWAGLLLPFQEPSAGDPLELVPFLFRLAAATLVVPFAEELLCRGYIFGLVTQWQEARRAGVAAPFDEAFEKRSVHQLAPGAWTALALFASSVAFAAGHLPAQWLAAFGYGVLMAGLWIVRGDLVAPITAHAVTNFALYLYVFVTESWWLW